MGQYTYVIYSILYDELFRNLPVQKWINLHYIYKTLSCRPAFELALALGPRTFSFPTEMYASHSCKLIDAALQMRWSLVHQVDIKWRSRHKCWPTWKSIQRDPYKSSSRGPAEWIQLLLSIYVVPQISPTVLNSRSWKEIIIPFNKNRPVPPAMGFLGDLLYPCLFHTNCL